MDTCIEVRELLEVAALEPGGIDRLEAGDSPDAARVAGHLAGCPQCSDELVRLRRAASVLHRSLAAAPDPALRERTLALVRAVGVERGPAAALAPAAPAAIAPPAPPTAIRPLRRSQPAWLAAAAVLVLAAFGAGFLLRVPATANPGPSRTPDSALATVAAANARIMGAPDAVEVALADPAGTAQGTLVAAPSRGEMVVLATGLPAAPAGSEYRCWIEVDGQRSRLGTMWLDGEVSWWAGPVKLPATVPPGTTFGVSLATGDSVGEPVLVGTN